MKNVAVVCGGYSGEYVVSLKSAELILSHIDHEKNRVFKVVIEDKTWKAFDMHENEWLINRSDFSFSKNNDIIHIDAVINAVHGTPGEDGKLQGYFDVLDIPYNGSDVLASSLTFNKGFCNNFLKQCGIEVADNVLLAKGDPIESQEIIQHVGLPCFVKPNDAGSSLGVSKVSELNKLKSAIESAFEFSDRVLIERFVDGTEITCGVVEYRGEVQAVAVTEIVFASEFFDFEAKYNSSSTQEITPARISQEDYERTMELSKRIYRLLGCQGFFRADYILSEGKLSLIEVNTVPGMSAASLMPQQLEYRGMSLKELLQEQIEALSN